MKKILASAAILSLAVATSPSALAADSSKEEMAGVGSGAIVGGLVGGPPGIVIGAAIGAVLGDKYHQKETSIEGLTDAVAHRDTQLSRMESDLTVERRRTENLRAEVAEIDRSGVRALYSAMDTGLSFTVPFRTDEDTPEQALVAQVNQIAATLADMPDLGVQIDGFADARGAVEYNAELSLRRASAVRDLLIEAGVDTGRIQTFGHGALTSFSGTDPVDLDELALQRRVVVTFYRDSGEEDALSARNLTPAE